jgi:CheY-like chemotaxis protein
MAAVGCAAGGCFEVMDDVERSALESLLKGKRVLVIDEESGSAALSEKLRAVGCSVDEVQHGAAAVELALANADGKLAYDLIFSAVTLPDMNGYDLLMRLKATGERVPLILMTGFGYDRDVWFVKVFRAGLHRKGVLFKPVRYDHLLRAAAGMLGAVEQHSNSLKTPDEGG